MAVFLLKRLTLQTIRTENNCIRCFNKHTVRKTPLSPTASAWRPPSLVHAQCLSTDEGAQDDRKKKASKTLTNTGRKIHARIIRVFSEEGTDLGPMHRADTIRLMEERALRLVQRDADAEPPEYQLMTGAQIHQERLRLREEEKAKPKSGPTVRKELTFSSNIGQHDLETKSKQIQQWIEKNYQVQITIKKGKNADDPEHKPEEIFDHILQTMPGMATFLSRPQPVKGGRACMCILRHLTKKEEKTHADSRAQKRDTLNKGNGGGGESDVIHP
ncbi:translation initiation factor IF-3, mitochondrial [Cavia porcellus]|uniref:Translation initiation factor IF-3, mitochondrial n=1 Tax=Cavia porcellus TaxID=10141 RepID=H0VG87_CAVPO|nr:translation initiation factor IF-3, mitochondrial [Cavia porcellus]XP_012996543.1 translation initiation factor IF-3, mitochondrial [Cavia porcellus]XP_023416212.1 translation initiation factor IF-3, mitochondrial [Cavia porcellus]